MANQVCFENVVPVYDDGCINKKISSNANNESTDEKDEFWLCADPACKTQNTFDTNICEKCKLSNRYTYEKSGKWGQTKVIQDNDTGIIYKKWTVINSFMNTINIRDSKMQNDFLKFSDNLASFLKFEQKRSPLEKADVDEPYECDIYILMSENTPFRVQFKCFNYDEADHSSPGVEDKVCWLVNFIDIGKWEVVDPNELIKLPSSSFEFQPPHMKRCLLEHIRFKTANSTKQAKINSWMKEQLLNKEFVINFNECSSNSRFRNNNMTSYADILLEDEQHFSEKVVEEFEDYLVYNENLNMENFIYVSYDRKHLTK